MDVPRLVAVIYKLEDNNYSLVQLDIPDSDIEKIDDILSEYVTRGCVVHGTRKQISKEIAALPYKNTENVTTEE